MPAVWGGGVVAAAGATLRSLRALRHDPPGYAKQGARRRTFQSALEQCEQFLAAAGEAGYATRPVQLFYALSQAGRAIMAASPRIGNQAWSVRGHGLTANTNADVAADISVAAAKDGLFPAVASALDVEALVADEPVVLRDLWPLLPEAAFAPLTAEALFPVLLFFPEKWLEADTFSAAQVSWIARRVRDLYGDDGARVKAHLDHYPALRSSLLRESGPPDRGLGWSSVGPGLTLEIEWRSGPPGPGRLDRKTLDDLGVARYRSDDDFVITPAIGSMSTGLHPFLALWAVLLALSSLARYEPARWSKMIDIDRSSEANAIEHLLEESTDSVPSAALHILTAFK